MLTMIFERKINMLKVLWSTMLVTALCISIEAQKAGTTSCTASVSRSDCSQASSAFLMSRDNKIFNTIDVVIADLPEFERQKSQINADLTRRFKNGETGLFGTVPLSGEDQDFVLILLGEKRPGAFRNITKIIVSVDGFYKLGIDSNGQPTKYKQFDLSAAVVLASKINGYVTGWFYAQLSMSS